MSYIDPDLVGYGVVIPGLGHANWGDTSFSSTWAIDRPVCLFTGEPFDAGSDFVMFDTLLDLSALGTKLNVLTGVQDAGDVSMTIPALGNGVAPDYSTTTLKLDAAQVFTRRRQEAQGLLATASLGPNDTLIDLWSRDGAQFSPYDTIYLEHKTIVLLDEVEVSGEVQTFQCYRGAYDSVAAYHQSLPIAGSKPDIISGWDNRIYTEWEPFGKFVYVVERTPGSVTGAKGAPVTTPASWTYGFAGWLTSEPQPTDNISQLSVPIVDLFSPFFGRSLNKEPHGAQWNGEFFRASRIFSSAVAPRQTVDLHANEVSDMYGPAARGASPRVVVQFKDAIVSAEFGELVTTDPVTGQHIVGHAYRLGPVIGGQETSTVLMNSPIPEVTVSDSAEREDLVEVLVGGTAMVDVTGSNYTCIATGWYPHHPLTALLVFMLSTGRGSNRQLGQRLFDFLSLKVALGIAARHVDVEGIVNEIIATSEQTTYGWCFGYGGNSFTWSDLRSTLLTPYGRFAHCNASYQMTVSRLEPIIADNVNITYSASDIIKFSETEKYGWDRRIQTLSANAALPWEKPKDIVARDVAQGVQVYDPDVLDPQYNLNVAAMRPIDSRGNGEQREATERALEWQRRPTPVRGFTIGAFGDQRPYAGAKVGIYIDVPVPWRGVDGLPLEVGTTLYGFVEQVDHDFNTHWYDLQLACINDQLVESPHLVSRSFRISSVIDNGDGTHTLRLPSRQHGVEYLTENPNLLSNFASKAVEIWDRSTGAVDLYTTGDNVTASIISVTLATGSNSLSFDLKITTPDDTLPQANQYVRLARRSNAGGEAVWEDVFSQTYLADDTETFSDGDRGKVYV